MPARPEVTGRRRRVTADEQQSNNNNTIADPLALLSKKALAQLLAVDPWTIDRWRRDDPDFPQPIWVTTTTPRWSRADVEEWLATRKKGGRSPAWDQQTNKPKHSRRATQDDRVAHGD